MYPILSKSARHLATPFLCASTLVLAACAAPIVGVAGYDAFMAGTPVVTLTGPQNARAAARCFEEQGKFLPLSEFSRETQPDTMTYRLRVAGQWFEQIQISEHQGGSRAEVRIAGNLNERWSNDFNRDRKLALVRCLDS